MAEQAEALMVSVMTPVAAGVAMAAINPVAVVAAILAWPAVTVAIAATSAGSAKASVPIMKVSVPVMTVAEVSIVAVTDRQAMTQIHRHVAAMAEIVGLGANAGG